MVSGGGLFRPRLCMPAPIHLLLSVRALALALVLAGTGCHAASGVLAVVLATKGDVTVGERNGGASVTPGEFLTPPKWIRTGANSAIVWSPLPGIIIRLEANSEWQLDEIALHKRGEEVASRRVRSRLAKGRARIWVDEFERGAVDFRIQSTAGELVVSRPVLAEISLEPDGSARLLCAGGRLTAEGVPVVIGQWLQLTPGAALPVPQEAADDAETWAQLLEVRRLEPQFAELQARQRERTPSQFEKLRLKAPKN